MPSHPDRVRVNYMTVVASEFERHPVMMIRTCITEMEIASVAWSQEAVYTMAHKTAKTVRDKILDMYRRRK